MDHKELVNLLLSVHGAIFLTSLVGFYKYGDRTEIMSRSLHGTEGLLASLRMRLSDALAQKLKLTFQDASTQPTILLTPDVAYTEKPTDPVESESYREAFREFIEAHQSQLVDFRSALLARDYWCRWARRLSWGILSLMIWEAISVGALALVDRVGGVVIPDVVVKLSVVPSVVVVTALFVALGAMLHQHDIINEKKLAHKID